jgi:uncharacterized ubiquitin-like protein YukD
MITATYSPKTEINNLNNETLLLYFQFPSLSGYRTKVIPKTKKVKEVIDYLNQTLPKNLQSDRYHLYNESGMRLLNEDLTLIDHHIKNKDKLDLKRGNEFEFNFDNKPIYIDGEISVKQVVGKFSEILFPDRAKGWDYSAQVRKNISNNNFDGTNGEIILPLVSDNRPFHTHRLRKGY